MSLERFCRKPVRCIAPAQTVVEAAQTMRDGHVGALVVTVSGRPQGVVTDRDLVCRTLAENRAPPATPVREVMSAPPILARVDETLDQAFFKMRRAGIRRLPIVDHHDQLVGLVSVDDLTVLLSSELSNAAHVMRDNAGP